jgi:hypothetical protein
MTDFVDGLRAQGMSFSATANCAERAIETATEKAETAIKRILIGLEEDTLRHVDQVNVDTRNFANLAVDIILKR